MKKLVLAVMCFGLLLVADNTFAWRLSKQELALAQWEIQSHGRQCKRAFDGYSDGHKRVVMCLDNKDQVVQYDLGMTPQDSERQGRFKKPLDILS